MAFVTVIFAGLGVSSPALRGSLLQVTHQVPRKSDKLYHLGHIYPKLRVRRFSIACVWILRVLNAQTMLILWAVMGSVAGYASARMYKLFKVCSPLRTGFVWLLRCTVSNANTYLASSFLLSNDSGDIGSCILPCTQEGVRRSGHRLLYY